MYACKKGFSEVAKALLEAHPFQLNWLSDDGDSALHVAAKSSHAAAVKMLLDMALQLCIIKIKTLRLKMVALVAVQIIGKIV